MANPIAVLARQLFSTTTPMARRPTRSVVFATYAATTIAVVVASGLADQHIATSIAALLLMAATIRVYSLLRSVGWIWKRGDLFADRYELLQQPIRDRIELRNDDDSDLLALYRRTGGAFFPFGVRAIVLRQRARDHAAANRRWRGLLLRAAYVVWKFYYFTPLWVIAVLGLTYGFESRLPTLARALGFISTEILLVGCLSIAAEAALSYIKFSSWSLAYHQFNVQPRRDVTELATFIGGIVALVFCSQAAMVFVAREFGGYDKVGSHFGFWPAVGMTLYYTITTLSGNGDAGPHSGAAFAVTATQYVIAVAFLVIVISLLFDALGRPPARTPGTPGGP